MPSTRSRARWRRLLSWAGQSTSLHGRSRVKIDKIINMAKKEKLQLKEVKIEESNRIYPHMDMINKVSREINEETDRGAALFSASLLDDALLNILSNYLVEGKVRKKMFKYPDPLSSFSARQNMCLVLGLISEAEYNNCNTIRSIRNKFAHSATYSIDFDTQAIDGLCRTFSSYERLKEKKGTAPHLNRLIFILTVQALLTRWIDRGEAVKAIKRSLLVDTAVNDLK